MKAHDGRRQAGAVRVRRRFAIRRGRRTAAAPVPDGAGGTGDPVSRQCGIGAADGSRRKAALQDRPAGAGLGSIGRHRLATGLEGRSQGARRARHRSPAPTLSGGCLDPARRVAPKSPLGGVRCRSGGAHLTSRRVCRETPPKCTERGFRKSPDGLGLSHDLRIAAADPALRAVAGRTRLFRSPVWHRGGSGCARPSPPSRRIAPYKQSLAGRPTHASPGRRVVP